MPPANPQHSPAHLVYTPSTFHEHDTAPMFINWFPRHMNNAIREIRYILPKVDLHSQVVDASPPYHSANPTIL